MRNGMNKLATHAVYFFEVGNILHRESVAHFMNSYKLSITDPAIGETDFMVLVEILCICAHDQGKDVWMLDDIKHRLANRGFGVDSKSPAHGWVHQHND